MRQPLAIALPLPVLLALVALVLVALAMAAVAVALRRSAPVLQPAPAWLHVPEPAASDEGE